MANTREIKIRLRGVRKTRQITRAMKMVATVKLRRAQAALAGSRPYAERMLAIVSDLMANLDLSGGESPFFARRPVRKMLLIVISSDRGLCGSMNANILRRAMRCIESPDGPGSALARPEVHVMPVGKKARECYRAREASPAPGAQYSTVEGASFDGLDASALGASCCSFFLKGEYDRIDICYNETVAALQHRAACITLFPLDPAQLLAGMKDSVRTLAGAIFEPVAGAMANDVVRAYVASRVRQIVLGAAVAEHAARMLMMDLATKNADELMAGMQLTMNKLRQLAITNELADITTGAEALA